MDSINFITSQEVDLSNCDQEAIHLPGCIQPHGVLLVVQEPDLKILQVSNNTEHFLDIPPQLLINTPLSGLFDESQISPLNKHPITEKLIFLNLLKLKRKVRGKYRVFATSVHRYDRVTILELEPFAKASDQELDDFYRLVKNSVLNIKKTSGFLETNQLIAEEIRQITDYDRVMIYRFEPDQSGIVIAESKNEKITESYLDLHYPASDIPKQARKLYYENWIRLIVDMNYQPVELIPTNNPLTNSPLDLSFSLLRSVSPIHVEYLQNMGVSASLCISLVDDQKLWGLIVCHHYSPKYVDYQIRNYCEFLGQLLSLELVKRQEKEAEKYRGEIRKIQINLRKSLEGEKKSIIKTLEKNSLQILELVRANGAAIYFDNHLTLLGNTPPEATIQELINELIVPERKELFYTRSLPKIYPQIQEFKDLASGLLSISIFLKDTAYHILWFRPEVIQTVNWGGDPNKAISVKDDGSLRLSPRRSFDLWKETVREKSLPWQQVEIDAAIELRNTLMLVALEFSQTALQEAAERAEVANRAKGQFLAKMSHELRTPLNAILGFSQLMNSDLSLSPENQDYIKIINRSGEHLLSLISDVLEMSKIEAGQMTLNESSFDLYALINTIHEMLQFKAANKRLKLNFEVSPEVPEYIISDQGKIRQILINLLDNALKFTQTGGVTLKVSRGEQPTQINFEVSDTGLGISPEEIGLLFDLFVQTETGRKSMQGAGLGLPISRQFVNLMGGEISVASTVGKGTTFRFNIQVRLTEESQVSSLNTSRRVIGLEPDQPNYKILIVEDVEENRRLLFHLLSSVGFEVESAKHGGEAVALWQLNKPDLILMDMLMPIMDGYEATRRIKNTEKGKETVIIAITASAFAEEKAAILATGCDGFMLKPYQEKILLDTIAEHLGVRYLYEDISSRGFSSACARLTSDDFKVMPKTWVLQLHQLSLRMDESEIVKLVQEIPETHQNLAEALINLVDDFRFDLIVDLTDFANE